MSPTLRWICTFALLGTVPFASGCPGPMTDDGGTDAADARVDARDGTADAPHDTGTDVVDAMPVDAADVTTDALPEAAPDVETDAGEDATPDVAMDTGDDAPADVAADVPADIEIDAGADTGTDAGTDVGIDVVTDTGIDTGVDAIVDTGPDTSAQIAAVRAAADGAISPALPIQSATVTYVVPMSGTDPAGFTVQASATGPALFVAVDAATLSPVPSVGDVVSFDVTTMGTVAGMREATAITNFTRSATGVDITPLVQNLSSATDLVTGVTNYESEVITLDGTVAGSFVASGASHVAAPLTTAGITSADPNLRLRLVDTVRDTLDLAPGCTLTLQNTPLWRFNAQAEPSAWSTSDVIVNSCPAPRVVSAVAVSATSVLLTFDRRIDPATVRSSGADFSIAFGGAGALPVTAASVSARSVTLTTATQMGGTSYTVTVGVGVADTIGARVDPSANTAMFTGFLSPATVVLNEINPNITGSHDLIELRVLAGGSIENIRIEQGVASPTVLATLPSVTVATGDIIVVHLGTPTATDATVSETTSISQFPTATFGSNYDTAWDVVGGTTGITFSNRVIRVLTPTNAVLDAVPFYATGGTPPAAFPADLQAIQASGDWLPADCGGALCTYTSSPTAQSVSVLWTGAASTSTGTSVHRVSADTNTSADWMLAPGSFGVP